MKLAAKRGFYDQQVDRYRPTGDVFVVDDQRAKELLAAGVAEVVEAASEDVEIVPGEPAPEVEKKPKRKKG